MSWQNSECSGLKFSSESKLFGGGPRAPAQLLLPCFAKKKKYNTTVVPEENMKLRLANRVQEPLNANFVHNMLFHQGAENQE